MPSRRTPAALTLVLACGLATLWSATASGRCCYRVQVNAAGSMHTDWGSDPAKQINGYHKIRWDWSTRQLMSYHQPDGFRQLGQACTEGSRSICARNKVRSWLHEESHIVESPSDDVSRNDRGPCTNDVTSGRTLSDWVDGRGSFQVAISVPKQNSAGRHLVFANAGPTVLGQAKFEDKCWFGVGDHSSTGHEPGADEAALESGSIWEVIVPAPARFRFGQKRRFVASGGRSFSHDYSFETIWPYHTTTRNTVVEIRFTPFPRRQLAEEIRQLNRLR